MSPPEHRTEPGPIVNGRQTTIHHLDSGTLTADSPLLNGMFETVNSAFSHCHPPWISAEFKRLLTPEQILHELYHEFFALVVTVDPSPEDPLSSPSVIATGCGLPAPRNVTSEIMPQEPGESVEVQEERKTRVERSDSLRVPLPGIVDWEMKMICVKPSFMRHGIAGRLRSMIEEGILERARKDDAKQKVRIMISTLKEMNGAWYERRGWVPVAKSPCEAGTLGGWEKFEIWHMDKIIG